MHRFLWLNSPSWSDLERSFGVPNLRPFSLVDGQRAPSNFGFSPISIDRHRLSLALGLSPQNWDSSTLGWLYGTQVDDVETDLRFCPLCLHAGYHTVAFQLSCVQRCPIHKHGLMHKCLRCGGAISPQLDLNAVRNPYACHYCGHLLAPKASLVSPPIIAGQCISGILDWYRRLSTLVIAVPRTSEAKQRPPIYSPRRRHACLEMLNGHLAPESITLERREVGAGQTTVARCGIRPTPRRHYPAINNEEAPHHTQIYKAYRRHVQKTQAHHNHGLIQDFIDCKRALWAPAASLTEVERRTFAYGLLLFRSRMENWPDIFAYARPCPYQHRRSDPPFSVRTVPCPRFSSPNRPLSSAEQHWLLDHLYGAAIQAVFQNALTHARKMAVIGQYRQGEALDWDQMPPYAVGFYHHGQLEFWSWNPHASQVCDAPRTTLETSL